MQFGGGDSLVQALFSLLLGSEYSNLLPAVQQDLIAEELLNVSVTRLIKGMLSLGVFDPPDKVNFSK